MHVLFYVVTALLFHAMFYMCIPCFYYVCILLIMLCQKWLATIIDLVHCRKILFPHVEDWLRVSSSEPMIWRQNIRIPACRNLATNTSVLVQNYLSILKSSWEPWLIFPRWNVGKTYFWNALQWRHIGVNGLASWMTSSIKTLTATKNLKRTPVLDRLSQRQITGRRQAFKPR